MRYVTLFAFVLAGCADHPAPPHDAADGAVDADLAVVGAPDLGDASDLAAHAASWKQESSAASFSDLWGSSPTDLYAVGAGGNVTGYVYHSPGGGVWSQIKVSGSLYAVWGSSANDVYVGGLNMILRSTDAGASWKPETLPAVGGSWLIDALWGSGSGDIYAAGFHTNASGDKVGSSILHSTGNGQWTTQYSDGSGDSFALWGADAGHVFAVDRDTGAVVRTSGDGSWTAHGALGASARIWGLGANQLYVAAASGVTFASSDALTWTPTTLPGASGETLEDIWGRASDDLFVVGNAGSIFHLSGGGWSREGSAGTKLRRLWSGGGELFAVGAGGIYHRQP
jgi:hypothetical protein